MKVYSTCMSCKMIVQTMALTIRPTATWRSCLTIVFIAWTRTLALTLTFTFWSIIARATRIWWTRSFFYRKFYLMQNDLSVIKASEFVIMQSISECILKVIINTNENSDYLPCDPLLEPPGWLPPIKKWIIWKKI